MTMKVQDSTRKLPDLPVPGVDCCFEPLPEKRLIKGPPETLQTRLTNSIRRTEANRRWAQQEVAMESLRLQAARYMTDPEQQAGVLMQLALGHFLLGDLPRGRYLTEQAAALWKAAGEVMGVAECLTRAAYFYQVDGDVKSAIELLERVVAMAIPAKYAPANYNNHVTLMELYQYQEDHESAAASARRALNVVLEWKLTEQEGMARFALALSLVKLSRWQEVLDAGLPALAIFQAAHDRENEHHLRFVLADSYEQLGQHRHAAQHYEAQLLQARSVRAPRTLMIELLMKSGNAWYRAGEQARAEAYMKEVLPLVDAEKSRPLAPVVRLNLSMMARDRGEPRRALGLLKDALAQAPEDMRPAVLMALGETYAILKNWDEAALAFRNAVTLARQRGDVAQETALLARLSALTERGEPAEAN